MTLAPVDWIIIAAYVLLTLGIALSFGRKASQSLEEYFISGRSLPWWIAGTSMVATTFAADTPLAVTGIVIKDGLAGNWIWWAFALGGMITVFVYARLWRRTRVVTDVELVELRYGGAPAAALRAIRSVYVSLLINAIIIGWVCGAMITFFKATIFEGQITSEAQQWWLLVGSLGVVGVYATVSGMWGVALTDVLQFVLAMAGCVILAIVAVRHVGGVDVLHEKVTSQFADGDQALSFFPRLGSDNAWMPVHAFLIMALMQWWATWYPGAEPGGGGYVVQRMASCRNERDSLLATFWFQLAHYCLRPWPWIMVAFVALAMFPELRENYLADKGFDPGKGYPMVIRDLAPAGLLGLMLVTFFAAFMSTISTQMNWGASYLVRDVYQRFIRPEASDRHYAWASRVASVIVLVAGGIAAWMMRGKSIDTIWNILLALGAGTGAVFMLRWFWWRINAWTEISAMLASLVFFLLIGVEGQGAIGTEFLTVGSPQVKIMIVALASIVCWLAVTLVTAPESPGKLADFYRLARPGGPGWRPVAQECPEVAVDRNLGSSIFCAFLAAGIVYSILPMTGYLIFGQYLSALMAAAIAVVCAAGVIVLVRRMGSENIL
jgi:Na+/proline symporter